MSESFTDRHGKEWSVGFTIGLMTEVREATGIKLGEVLRTDEGLAEFIFGDVEQFGRLLWCVCREQAEERGVSPEEFADCFDGPALERATEAVLRGIANFSPRSKIAAQIKSNLALVLEKADERAVAALKKAADEAK